MTINKLEFWGSNYYNHPDLSDQMIDLAEKSLMVKLPNTLVELLKIQNGGYTQGFVFPTNQKTTWAPDHVPLNELFGIVTDSSIKTAQNILSTNYMTEEWGLPENQILLTGEGHWWITLDYRNRSQPTLRWIDVECNEDIHLADNFEDFIEGLVSESKFEED